MTEYSDFKTEGTTLIRYLGRAEEVTVPDGIEYIDDRAFELCIFVKKITLPDSVSEVGCRAFCGCGSLREVIFTSSPLKIGEGIFANCYDLKAISILSRTGAYESLGECIIHKRTKALVAGCSESVIPEKRVTSIAPSAFEGLAQLLKINIPSGVVSIGDFAFSRCGLLKIAIPETVRKIGKNAFEGCKSLKSVAFSEGLLRLSSLAFHGCSALESAALPKSIEEIGVNPFADCKNLKSISVHDDCERYTNRCGCIMEKSTKTVISSVSPLKIPEDALVIGELGCAFTLCRGGLTVPEGIRKIGKGGFSGCVIEGDAIIPETVTEICSNVFSICMGLKRLIILGNPRVGGGIVDGMLSPQLIAPKMPITALRGFEVISYIGMAQHRFSGNECDGEVLATYKRFAQRNKNTVVALSKDNIECLRLTLELRALDKTAASGLFEYYKETDNAEIITMLMEYTAGERKKEESVLGFDDELSFDSIFAPKTLTELKREWKYEKKADGTVRLLLYIGTECRVTVPEYFGKSRVSEIGACALLACGVTSVTLPVSVTVIGDRAFEGCERLCEVSLPKFLAKIGDKAFSGCRSLCKVDIPDSVSHIGKEAFFGCLALSELVLPRSLSSLGDCAFSRSGLSRLSVRDGCEKYFSVSDCLIERDGGVLVAAAGTRIPDDAGVVALGQAYMYNEGLYDLVIPDCIETIECNALEGCVNLQRVVLPKGLSELPSFVFSGCFDLAEVYAGPDICEIGLFPFDGCEGAVIYVPSGSETERCCKENGIPTKSV